MMDLDSELEEDTQYGKFLTFNLGKEIFGIDIYYVTEIVGMQSITGIPEVPTYMKGVINLRGKIIPVVDVRLKFKKDPVEYNERTCIVIINIDQNSVGLIVDNVNEVISIPDECISPPPNIRTGIETRYIKGIGRQGQEMQLLLDCENIFEPEEIQGIA